MYSTSLHMPSNSGMCHYLKNILHCRLILKSSELSAAKCSSFQTSRADLWVGPTCTLLHRRNITVETALSHHGSELTDREKRLLDRLYNGLVGGQRASLAESITLVETQHPRKKELAQVLLQRVLAFRQQLERQNGGKPVAFRVGEYTQYLKVQSLTGNGTKSSVQKIARALLRTIN
uniref:Uncharacterized protein n=1 Tax=Astyanax mexicanus TaxID=7994 RepID=A0A8B9LZD7_ASTMX